MTTKQKPAVEEFEEPNYLLNWPDTKIGVVIHLLRRKGGVTLGELITQTGWQRHSVRAAICGLRKKGYGIIHTGRGFYGIYTMSDEE